MTAYYHMCASIDYCHYRKIVVSTVFDTILHFLGTYLAGYYHMYAAINRPPQKKKLSICYNFHGLFYWHHHGSVGSYKLQVLG